MQSSIGPAQSMEHRYIEYHYSKLSTYSIIHIYTASRSNPPFETQLQQIMYSLINVCTESLFETVSFLTALKCVKLYMLSFDVELLERYVIHLLLMKMKHFM